MINQGECRSIEDFFKDRKGMMYKVNEGKDGKDSCLEKFSFFFIIIVFNTQIEGLYIFLDYSERKAILKPS